MRQRLVLSTLSGRPVKIRKIRAKDDNPGLRGWLVRELRGESLGTIWGEGVEPGGKEVGGRLLRVPVGGSPAERRLAGGLNSRGGKGS